MNKIKLIVLAVSVMAAFGVPAADDLPKAVQSKPAVKGPLLKLIDQRIDLAADGSGKLSATVEVEGAAPGRLELPFGSWGEVQDFRVDEAPADVKADLLMKGATPRLVLTLPQNVAVNVKLNLSFAKPAPKPAAPKDGKGAEPVAPEHYKTFAHRFLNGTTLTVERYRLRVVLPEGYMVHTVPEALPKAKAAEGKSRVQLGAREGRQEAVLDAPGVRFAESTSMRIEYEPEKKSLAVLWIGVVLAALYLVFFRDILHPAPAGEVEDHSHRPHE